MVLELLVGFAALVAASYIGTTMALRGFFDDTPVDEAPTDRTDGRAGESGDD